MSEIIFRRGLYNEDLRDIEETRAKSIQKEIVCRLENMTPQERRDLFDELKEEAYRIGLKIEDKPIPVLPTPLPLPLASIEAARRGLNVVTDLMFRLEDLAFSGDPLGNQILERVYTTMPPNYANMMMKAYNTPSEIARLRNCRIDCFWPLNTDPQILELNTIAPEGILYHFPLGILASSFLKKLRFNQAVIECVEEQQRISAPYQVLEMLINTVKILKDRSPRRIAILYDDCGEEDKINATELPYLATLFERIAKNAYQLDLEVVLVNTPLEIEARDGIMRARGKDIDGIWKNNLHTARYIGVTPEGLTCQGEEMIEIPGLLEVISNPHIYPIQNTERSRFMANKKLMTYLFDYQVLRAIGATEEEIKIASHFIPTTFDPSLVKQIRYDKDGDQGFMSIEEFLMNPETASQIVLKPIFGTHGNGVVFGVNFDSEYLNAVDKALSEGGYIVQQYIPYQAITFKVPFVSQEGDLEMLPVYRDTNFHLINGKVAGTTICRVVPVTEGEIRVLNVAAGGWIQPSFYI